MNFSDGWPWNLGAFLYMPESINLKIIVAILDAVSKRIRAVSETM